MRGGGGRKGALAEREETVTGGVQTGGDGGGVSSACVAARLQIVLLCLSTELSEGTLVHHLRGMHFNETFFSHIAMAIPLKT